MMRWVMVMMLTMIVVMIMLTICDDYDDNVHIVINIDDDELLIKIIIRYNEKSPGEVEAILALS